MIRSARSMMPPLAFNPRDSALARSYEMIELTDATARGTRAMCAECSSMKYQATPPKSSASVTRSMTESKKAPRWLEVFDALARAPSRRSGSAARMTRSDRGGDGDDETGHGEMIGRHSGSTEAVSEWLDGLVDRTTQVTVEHAVSLRRRRGRRGIIRTLIVPCFEVVLDEMFLDGTIDSVDEHQASS
jgi:hypothetical protein